MLESIHLKNVGPAPEMKMDLAPRLNLITGDNGLGKTLLLDSVWWALTRTWPLTWGGKGIVPERQDAGIDWVEQRGDLVIITEASYDFDGAVWKTTKQTQAQRADTLGGGLVVYLRVDGGISVHDPLRTGEDFRLPAGARAVGRSHSFQFLERDIWEGLTLSDNGTFVCEGLVRDVVRWAVEPGNAEFDQLAALVGQLAGAELFRLTRKVERVYVDDPRDFPVVAGPTGELPVTHAPAGLRRILGLAYLVVWAWREHKAMARLKKRRPSHSLVLLIDEVESHLHPKWQRKIVPSLLRALNHEVHLQLVAATHSPLVLASVEPTFDQNQDAWFDLDLEQRKVILRKRPYIRQGEIGNWLVSEAFDLKEPRSLEGEQAVAAAEALMQETEPAEAAIKAADEGLRKAGLPDIDTFWVRWRYFRDRSLAMPPKATAKTPPRRPK